MGTIVSIVPLTMNSTRDKLGAKLVPKSKFTISLVNVCLVSIILHYPLSSAALIDPLAAAEHLEDHYVLLSDDELTSNADLLSYLAFATKEEIEDLVASNPLVQQNILKKIEAIIRIKQAAGTLSSITGHKSIEIVDDNNHEIVEEYDDQDDEEDRKKVEAIKMKLKSKAAKLIRIGDGFKRKLVELGKKKLRKFKKKRRRPAKQHRPHPSDIDEDDDDEDDGGGGEVDLEASKNNHYNNMGPPGPQMILPPPPKPAPPPYGAQSGGAPRFHFNVSTSSKKRRRRR